MFAQVFIKTNREYRRAAVISITEDYEISDIKLVLREHTKIPVEHQKIMFFGTVLKDEYLLSKVAKKCNADLLAYHNNELFGRIQFLDDLDPRSRSMLKLNDQDVDMELSNKAGPQTIRLAGGCSATDSSEPSISDSSSMRSCFMAPQSSRSAYCPNSAGNTCVYEDPCEIKCCEDNCPPYARVMPENRRYGVVITNEECPGECNFNCILEFLAEAFHTTQDVASLSFSQCTPVAEFDGFLLLVAEDTESSDWLLRVAQPMCPPYRCMSFIRHFELVRCTFVIPMVVERALCSVFHIFENQNCGLDTGKWCVMKTTPLDPCSETYDSKVIFRDSVNLEIMAYIDVESKSYIEQHCSKIKYITWHLPVEFSHGMTCASI